MRFLLILPYLIELLHVLNEYLFSICLIVRFCLERNLLHDDRFLLCVQHRSCCAAWNSLLKLVFRKHITAPHLLDAVFLKQPSILTLVESLLVKPLALDHFLAYSLHFLSRFASLFVFFLQQQDSIILHLQ